MVIVVLGLKCIILKYMLETIYYDKVEPVIYWAQLYITIETIKCTVPFIKKLRILKSLVWSTCL